MEGGDWEGEGGGLVSGFEVRVLDGLGEGEVVVGACGG